MFLVIYSLSVVWNAREGVLVCLFYINDWGYSQCFLFWHFDHFPCFMNFKGGLLSPDVTESCWFWNNKRREDGTQQKNRKNSHICTFIGFIIGSAGDKTCIQECLCNRSRFVCVYNRIVTFWRNVVFNSTMRSDRKYKICLVKDQVVKTCAYLQSKWAV